MQGEQFTAAAQAFRRGDPVIAGITEPEAQLLDFVATITRHAYRVTPAQVRALNSAGWSDGQIAEAVYVAALFNLFVRLADSFGIEPPALYEPDGVPAVITAAADHSLTPTIPLPAV